MIRELARKLATFNQFADFVIVEIIFRWGNFDSTAQIVKNFSSRVTLRSTSPDAEVLVKMIRPRHEVKVCELKPTENFWRTFTAKEIFDFAAEVGDKNPIHQLNPPIVPAFLILESICAEFKANFKLRFKNFIVAGETLNLNVADNSFEITCAGIEKVTGEFL